MAHRPTKGLGKTEWTVGRRVVDSLRSRVPSPGSPQAREGSYGGVGLLDRLAVCRYASMALGSEISELMTIVEAGPGFSDGAQKRVNAGEGVVHGATLSAVGQVRLGAGSWSRIAAMPGSMETLTRGLALHVDPFCQARSRYALKQTSLSFMARYDPSNATCHPSMLTVRR